MTKYLTKILFIIFVFSLGHLAAASNSNNVTLTTSINNYINTTWDKLTRSNKDILEIVYDVKFPPKPNEKPIIYVSQKENLQKVKNEIAKASPAAIDKVDIRYLPDNINDIKQQGLLYLPYPYVTPGGRFNEMYGWDSYFIVLGLLQGHRFGLAKNMVDNAIYEINFYGTLLNANRSYMLTRSQPPLLTEMILAVYQQSHDIAWLKSTLPAILKLHQYWTTPPHLVPAIGLSRYYSFGEGPAPEVVSNENYYQTAKQYYRTHQVNGYDVSKYYNANTDQLTNEFYINDRTVRESGFDLSNQYGHFNTMITDFIPVSLNTLLYQMELDTAEIYEILQDPTNAKKWSALAKQRAQLINHYLWDQSLGYYFDYNFKTKQIYPYVYATTFYPLWAGVASPQQAEQVMRNMPALEGKGGIVTSAYVTGNQWDAPFGWAPLQYFAVKGMVRYGYCQDALRVANNFLTTINNAFAQQHVILEKYNVRSGATDIERDIRYGYTGNQEGFGWTNAIYLVFQKFVNDPVCTSI